MKKIFVLFLVAVFVFTLSACDLYNDYEYYSDTSDSKNTVQSGKLSSQSAEAQDTSPYLTGTVKVYAKNDSYDYYDMIFSNNRLIYVDLDDSNGFFDENCKGTFGKDAPNPIQLSGMTALTVEDAIEFFESKGFEVTVTLE